MRLLLLLLIRRLLLLRLLLLGLLLPLVVLVLALALGVLTRLIAAIRLSSRFTNGSSQIVDVFLDFRLTAELFVLHTRPLSLVRDRAHFALRFAFRLLIGAGFAGTGIGLGRAGTHTGIHSGSAPHVGPALLGRLVGLTGISIRPAVGRGARCRTLFFGVANLSQAFLRLTRARILLVTAVLPALGEDLARCQKDGA